MDKIILLYDDNTYKSKFENEITKKDIANTKYLLINSTPMKSTSDQKAFTITTAPKYFFFDEAIVDYQIAIFTTSSDCIDNVTMKDMHVIVKTYSELIGLIHSIDKINAVNNLINVTLEDTSFYISIMYFGIKLVKDGKTVLDKFYQDIPSSRDFHNSYKITSKFKEIYKSDISNDIYNKKLGFVFTHKKWDLVKFTDNSFCTYNFMGFVSPMSNIIVLLTNIEYQKLMTYNKGMISAIVYSDTMKKIEEIEVKILNGKDYDTRNLGDSNECYLYGENRAIYLSSNMIGYFLDYIVHADFICQFLIMIYSELYFYNDENGEYGLDSVLTFQFIPKNKNKKLMCREIKMTQNSIMSLKDILLLI